MLCIASFCLPEFMSKLSHQLTALRSEALGRELSSKSGVPADGLCALMKRPGGGVHPPSSATSTVKTQRRAPLVMQE